MERRENDPAEERPQAAPATLGDILYATCQVSAPEHDWANLVRSIAAGDHLALHALYERAHRIVFTLIMRITANREVAEELTVVVFHDVWRRAPNYDAANGTVLAWIMNQARARAVDRLRFERLKKDRNAGPPATADNSHDARPTRVLADSLRAALAALAPEERQAIEATFFAGRTHAEAAARLEEPAGSIKARIHAGMRKLRDAFGGELASNE